MPDYQFYEGTAPETPAVSIIIPVYNTLRYLNRCLESVCLQTEQNIEIIIVDDASPDASWGLIQEYARRDSRIVKIRHEVSKHSGGARNTGIRAARGEWLLFVDSDDYIRRDTVEIFLKKTEGHPDIKLLVCSVSKTKETIGRTEFFCGSDVDTLICEPFAHYCEERSPYILNCPWAKFWKKELFDCISFIEGVAFQDFGTIPMLLAGLEKSLYIPDRLFYYQENRNGVTLSKMSEKKVKDICQVLSRLCLWGLEQSVDRQMLLYVRLFSETDSWFLRLLESKKSNANYLEDFLESFPKDLLTEYIGNKLKDIRRLQADVSVSRQRVSVSRQRVSVSSKIAGIVLGSFHASERYGLWVRF